MKEITVRKPSKMKVLTEGELNARGIFGGPRETSAIKHYGKFPYSGFALFRKASGYTYYYECDGKNIPSLMLDSYSYGRCTKEKYLEEIAKCIDEYEAYADGSCVTVEGDENDVAEIESRWLKYLRAREALERIGIL